LGNSPSTASIDTLLALSEIEKWDDTGLLVVNWVFLDDTLRKEASVRVWWCSG